MSSKGGSNRSKRISLSRARHIARKAFTWAIHPSTGPHEQKNVVPLGEIVRDSLGLASNRKETKSILNSKRVLVDEKVRTSLQFPVGLFDIVRVQDERYRTVFDNKGRIRLQSMDEKEKPHKICKILRKQVVGKNQFQLTTNDGRTFLVTDSKIRVQDSVVIELPKQKIIDVIPMQPGNLAYVLSGTHTGAFERIAQITPATMQKDGLVELKNEDTSFQTLLENIMIVGEKTPAIKIHPTSKKD